jgi:hypothetical protein
VELLFLITSRNATNFKIPLEQIHSLYNKNNYDIGKDEFDGLTGQKTTDR